MKKIFIILLLLTIFMENGVFAFEWWSFDKSSWMLKWDLGVNFYKKIDESIWELEQWFFEREFTGRKKEWKITTILNKVAKSEGLPECFTKETSFKDIEFFILWNIWLIKKILDEECTKALPANSYRQYHKVILETHRIMREKSEEKLEKTARLMKAWIYSDWNLQNSTFDLISDIDDINKILFNQKIDYYWDYNENIWDGTILVKELLKWNNPSEAFKLATKWQNQIWTDIKIINPLENLRPTSMVDWNTVLCAPSPENNASGLNPETYGALTESLELAKDDNNDWNNNENAWLVDATDEEIWKRTPTDYAKKNDDWVWVWCWWSEENNDDYSFEAAFCIDVSFNTTKHNLLWWWQVQTIQWLLERSNAHLKPFANSSLAASKMWVNNFEIWFLDLNLPDLFHVTINVRWEPVPILNLKKSNDNEKNWDLTVENMLEKYFRNAWLMYKRENDLKIYRWVDENNQNTNKSKWQPSNKYANLSRELSSINREKRKITINNFDELMKNQINAQEWTEIYSMFTEIVGFTKRMQNYSQDLNIIIKKMKDIPSI